jgi:hypothetical protein
MTWKYFLNYRHARHRFSCSLKKTIFMAKYSKKAGKTVESAMRRRKKGTLKSGRSGRTVKSRKQAIAIGLSEAREKGAKVPKKKGAGKKAASKKSSGRKKSATKKSSRGGSKSAGRKKSTGRKSSGGRKKSTGRKSARKKSSR